MRALVLAGMLLGATLLAGCAQDRQREWPVARGGSVDGWTVHVVSILSDPRLVTHSGVAADWKVGPRVVIRNDSATEPLRIAILGNDSQEIHAQTYALPLPLGETDAFHVGFRADTAAPEAARAVVFSTSKDAVVVELHGAKGDAAAPARGSAPLKPGSASVELGPWDVVFVGAEWRDDSGWTDRLTVRATATAREAVPEGAPLPVMRVHLGMPGWTGYTQNTTGWPREAGASASVEGVLLAQPDRAMTGPYLAMLAWADESIVMEIPAPAKR